MWGKIHDLFIKQYPNINIRNTNQLKNVYEYRTNHQSSKLMRTNDLYTTSTSDLNVTLNSSSLVQSAASITLTDNNCIDASNSADVINNSSSSINNNNNNNNSSSSSSSNGTIVSTYNQDTLNSIILKNPEKGKAFTDAEKKIFHNILINKFSEKEIVWKDFWKYYMDDCKVHIIVNGINNGTDNDVYFRSKDQLKERMKTIKRTVDTFTQNKSVHIQNYFTTQN